MDTVSMYDSGSGEGTMNVAIDEPLRLLSTRLRRLVLLELRRNPRTTTVSSVAESVAVDTSDAALSLQHCHLPKLADHGYVDWDRDTDELSRGPQFEEVDALLELFEDHADELPFNWP
jgi:hypothetical protein